MKIKEDQQTPDSGIYEKFPCQNLSNYADLNELFCRTHLRGWTKGREIGLIMGDELLQNLQPARKMEVKNRYGDT